MIFKSQSTATKGYDNKKEKNVKQIKCGDWFPNPNDEKRDQK